MSLPFPEKPKSLPRMLSYGAGSSLFTLKCSADFQVSPPRKRWPLGFFRLPLRRVAEPLTLGTILGAAPLWGFEGADFDFSFVPSRLLPANFRSQPSHSFERLVADPKLVELPQEWP